MSSGARGTLRLVLVGVVAVSAAGVGLASGAVGGSSTEAPGGVVAATDRPPEASATTAASAISVPEGKVPVAFDDDGVPGLAGFVDEAAEGMDAPPDLAVGSGRHPARGHEVTDAVGAHVGYLVESVGFVDLTTAADLEAMDALLADAAARSEAGRMTDDDLARVLDEGSG